MRKRVILGSSFVALIILTGVGMGFGLSKIGMARRSPALLSQQPRGQEEAVDSRPLKERARQAGHYVSIGHPTGAATFRNLVGLAQGSSAVVIGIPQDNACNLSADGKSITIDYRVRVEYVYKGALKEGNIITVSVPGGRVSFADGSTAEIKTPWFKKMQAGQAYALFLTPGANQGSYVTTGQAQGVFEIPTTKESREVKAYTGIPNDDMWKYHGMNVRAFLKEVRQASGKKGKV